MVLISPEFSWWRNAFGGVVAIVIIPVAMLAKIISMPFERPAKRTADEAAAYLRNTLDGTGGDGDWDDFCSIPIADPGLESIRQRAAALRCPYGPDERAGLEQLLREADQLSQTRPT